VIAAPRPHIITTASGRDHMSDQRPTPQGEQPRSEPEIILPGDRDRWREGRSRSWLFSGQQGTHRIYVSRLGPFSTFLLIAAVGLAAALFLVVLLGAFLLWIPIVGLVISIAIISGLLRRYFQRLG
jgi:hypothetical protein